MLEPIVRALGQAKTADLPALHSFSGADNTGSFEYHAKPLCWKAFQGMHEDDIREMAKLGRAPKPYDNTIAAFEKLFCKIYAPKTSLTKARVLDGFYLERGKPNPKSYLRAKQLFVKLLLEPTIKAMVIGVVQ